MFFCFTVFFPAANGRQKIHGIFVYDLQKAKTRFQKNLQREPPEGINRWHHFLSNADNHWL
jgi:hypothetical protein